MGSPAAEKRSKASNPKNPKIKQNPIGPSQDQAEVQEEEGQDQGWAYTKCAKQPWKQRRGTARLSSEAAALFFPRSVSVCQWGPAFFSRVGIHQRYFYCALLGFQRRDIFLVDKSLSRLNWSDTCIAEPSQDANQDVQNLGKHMKVAFGSSWKETLCGKQLSEGKADPGCPALLIVCSSALRSIELLRFDCCSFHSHCFFFRTIWMVYVSSVPVMCHTSCF